MAVQKQHAYVSISFKFLSFFESKERKRKREREKRQRENGDEINGNAYRMCGALCKNLNVNFPEKL